jgi:BirA family biotin operon repressor/biotin-[acetyl-CoA-carboxylase] ligase
LHGKSEHSGIALLMGNCIHQALLSAYPELSGNLTIKWPNDIMLDGRKIAGILAERYPAFDYTLIGIGIASNVAEVPAQLETVASTLMSYLGKPVLNKQLINAIFDNLTNSLPQYLETGIGSFIAYHNTHSFLLGKSVELRTEFGSYEGRCCGVNREGALDLELANGVRQPFLSGSVFRLPEPGVLNSH